MLLHSDFIPMEPQFMYPVIRAQDKTTAIIGVYALHKVIQIDQNHKQVKLINATKADQLYLQLDRPCMVQTVIRNTMGEVIREAEYEWLEGVVCLKVPCSGLAELTLC